MTPQATVTCRYSAAPLGWAGWGVDVPGTCWQRGSPWSSGQQQKALLALWVPVPVDRAQRRSPASSPQNVYAPEEDPELRVQRYQRTFQQNEELGLNDMKTEGYEAQPASGR